MLKNQLPEASTQRQTLVHRLSRLESKHRYSKEKQSSDRVQNSSHPAWTQVIQRLNVDRSWYPHSLQSASRLVRATRIRRLSKNETNGTDFYLKNETKLTSRVMSFGRSYQRGEEDATKLSRKSKSHYYWRYQFKTTYREETENYLNPLINTSKDTWETDSI
jgi:hypothetical protein